MTAEELCIGKWKLDLSKDENLEEYYKAVGVSKPLRMIAKKLKGSVLYSIENDKWTAKTINTFQTVANEFKLGEWFTFVTVDKKTTTNLIKMEGNKLVSITKGYGDHDIHVTREFFEDYMTETVSANGVIAKRRYNKE